MSLPVSQYEALLAEVRGLGRKARRVRQLATPLISNCETDVNPPLPTLQNDDVRFYNLNYNMDPLEGRQYNPLCDVATTSSSEDECGGARSTHLSVSSEPISHRDRNVDVLYHGTWPVEKTMWNSEPIPRNSTQLPNTHMDVTSVMSFASSSGGVALDRVLGSPDLSRRSSQQLEAKVDMVYSLLAMLSGQEHADMEETLLALSTNPESCLAMRQSGCIPLLVQMVQSDREVETRQKAAQALHNLVLSQTDEKLKKREIRIFRLMEHVRAYTEAVRGQKEGELEVASSATEDADKHPVQSVAHVMKLSFDELHRQVICQLGGIHTIANLVEAEHVIHGSTLIDRHCILMRRYACMALTNLTFGDSGNKALLCSFREFMRALVLQLQSPSDELRQVTASVLRNLSWRPDSSSKEIFREVGSVSGLMKAAMLDNKENTLKSILSALWNLSAHCIENKSEICSTENALGFLVDMLAYKTPSKSLAIIENSGGILRNVSSMIAVRDDYREILREHNCLEILLDQLKSPSLTIVNNACGTLWNLSAKNHTDQEILWRLGAPSMLRSLNHSKHKMIAMGSSAALKNLVRAKPNGAVLPTVDNTALTMDLPALPTLGARKQKALLQDLDQNLSETYENIEGSSPIKSVVKDSSDNGEFSSLIVGNSRPSTSFDTGCTSTSLPYVTVNNNNNSNKTVGSKLSTGIPISGANCRKSFGYRSLKPTKSFTKNSSSSEQNDKSLCGLDFDTRLKTSSTNSLDNDKPKLKEISTCSDEKDRCSIEDISDTDQLLFGIERRSLLDEFSNCSDDIAVRKVSSPSNFTLTNVSVPTPKIHFMSSDLTPFDGDLDEVDMDDISIDFPPTLQDEETEKQDVEKEKKMVLSAVVEDNLTDFIKSSPPAIVSSGIPLPRSLPRPIPSTSAARKQPETSDKSSTEIVIIPNDNDTSVKKTNFLFSQLGRLPASSTPVRVEDTNDSDNPGVCGNSSLEANKVDNLIIGISPVVDSAGKMSLECSVPSLNCLSYTSVSRIDQVHLNISQEQNTSQSESPPIINLENPNSSQECPYLTPEALVNFRIKDDRDRLLERSCEESNVDNRMLDPDAMIESLDRFTAELVSQASHLQDSFKDNTWNEDTSPNDLTVPSISSNAPNVITFDSTSSHVNVDQTNDNKREPDEGQSNDFSSINTSTMTESTLIAMEAIKMASVFKNEADMSLSVTSLELDKVEPPSFLDSLPRSPMPQRKLLPRGLMVKRALSNSLNTNSSLESLDNHSWSNLDLVNPPSVFGEVLDMEASMTSVASLPRECSNSPNFLINAPVHKAKMTSQLTQMNSVISDLDNVNPPSLFNEITDLCNSLADVPTEAIGSETEIFEDCQTHVLPTETEDEVTEFSDANSATPLQSDLDSPETSPKRRMVLSKSMTSKQKRNMARDRYKTYTVAAEMVMKQEQPATSDNQNCSTSDDFKTVECFSEEYKSVFESDVSKMTPKERRKVDRERFETRVVSPTEILAVKVANQSPSRSKLSIRRNFIQKRLENRDRFKTQTLTEPTLSDSPLPDSSESSHADGDMHFLVEKEANLVLKSLRETKSKADELLDCETLSLVSNDDDSEQTSASSVNYRTYHKSWGLKRNIPVIDNQVDKEKIRCPEEGSKLVKPKIVKPCDKKVDIPQIVTDDNTEEQVKVIRGRRKALYSKSTLSNKIAPKTIKPIKTMTSNLVKNVTSSFKNATKSPVTNNNRTSGSQSRFLNSFGSSSSKTNSTKTSPARTISTPKSGSGRLLKNPGSPLDRQGTFTKDDAQAAVTKSRIPMSGSRINSKIPAKCPSNQSRPKSVNALNSDRSVAKNLRTNYARSTSADGPRKIPTSVSTQSLKNERTVSGAVKKIPVPSAVAVGSSGAVASIPNGTSARKQVTSKIASLLKKIEESKNKSPANKKDTRIWIQNQSNNPPPALVRKNTVENQDGVVLRKKSQEPDATKRVSRLGSFVVVDETVEDGAGAPQII